MLTDIFKSLRIPNSFVQNFAIVFGGKSIIFILGFLLTPIIARVYDPEAYGFFAFYSSIVLPCTVIATMKLPTAFIVANDQELPTLIKLTFKVSLLVTILIGILLYLFEDLIVTVTKNPKFDGIWLLVVAGVLLNSLTQIFGHWNIAKKAFKQSSMVAIIESFGTKVSTLLIGWKTGGIFTGLVLGEFLGKGFHFFSQWKLFLKTELKHTLMSSGISNKEVFIKYRDYPKVLMPAFFLNQMSGTVIILYLSAIYDPEIVGSYGMAVGLLAIPVMLLANAAQPILTQKTAEMNRINISSSNNLNKFLVTLGAIALIPTFTAILVGEPLTYWILGDQWEITSKIVSLMGPLLFLNILFVPLSGALLGLKKNKTYLMLYVVKVVLLVAIITVLPYVTTNYFDGVRLFIVGSIITSGVILIIAISMLKIAYDRKLILVFGLFILGCLGCFALSDLLF